LFTPLQEEIFVSDADALRDRRSRLRLRRVFEWLRLPAAGLAVAGVANECIQTRWSFRTAFGMTGNGPWLAWLHSLAATEGETVHQAGSAHDAAWAFM